MFLGLFLISFYLSAIVIFKYICNTKLNNAFQKNAWVSIKNYNCRICIVLFVPSTHKKTSHWEFWYCFYQANNPWKSAFGRSGFFDDVFPLIQKLYSLEYNSLSIFNINSTNLPFFTTIILLVLTVQNLNNTVSSKNEQVNTHPHKPFRF